jgi:hypothetical protein
LVFIGRSVKRDLFLDVASMLAISELGLSFLRVEIRVASVAGFAWGATLHGGMVVTELVTLAS